MGVKKPEQIVEHEYTFLENMGVTFCLIIFSAVVIGICVGIVNSIKYFQDLNAKQYSFQGSIYELNAKTSDLQDRLNNALPFLINTSNLMVNSGVPTKGWECTKTDTWDCTQDTENPKEMVLHQGNAGQIIRDVT